MTDTDAQINNNIDKLDVSLAMEKISLEKDKP